MDGGVVDNQGIEPIILAEERMARCTGSTDGKCLDLVIISDVASPYMNAYTPSNFCLPKSIGNLTLKKLSGRLWIAGIVATGVVAASYIFTSASFFIRFSNGPLGTVGWSSHSLCYPEKETDSYC